ncbi:hypothetical protein EB796_008005 [Bugula neritina]|uniref:Uncharacterized protein n=1 Tax=Bugula neritina TaxID=10212 RepID=A0A7J7K618_BUGNE|nr:hypothetical protein EB796_008005 [Bugula neritina]
MITAINSRFTDLNRFPKLVLSLKNRSDSFKKWLVKYNLAVRLATLEMGTETVSGDTVNRFRGKTKFLALLNAIGDSGIEVLQSLGLDLERNDNTAHDEALKWLKGHYEKTENIHVAWVKAATLSQTCGEDELEYLLRVEKHSRKLGFVEGADVENIRERFAISMAVVGLRDESVRRQLMVDENITWKTLLDTLKTKSIAKESNIVVSEARSGGSSNVDSSAKVAEVRTKPAKRMGGGSPIRSSYDDERDSRKYRKSSMSPKSNRYRESLCYICYKPD